MKMEISEDNPIVKEVMFKNVASHIKIYKKIEEYANWKYAMYTDAELDTAYFGFWCFDFDTIYNYSGKEMFETMYKDYPYKLKQQALNMEYSVVFSINISKYKGIHKKPPKGSSEEEKEKHYASLEPQKKEAESFAEIVSDLFAKFRCNLYESMIRKMLNEVKDRKNPTGLKVRLANVDSMFLMPTGEKLMVGYGFAFENPTDQSLAKLFFQELSDAKVSGSTIDVKFFEKQPFMQDITKLDSSCGKFTTGFVVFSKTLF